MKFAGIFVRLNIQDQGEKQMPAFRKIFVFLTVFLFCFCAFDEEIYADTHTAASCSLPDVQTAYNAASAGDTVAIPVGSCTWTSSLNISKALTLLGSGVTKTILTYDSDNPTINISLTSDVPVRITGIKFDKVTNVPPSRHAIKINGKTDGGFGLSKIRIDHNEFNKGGRQIFATGWACGVIDQNTFVNGNIAIGIRGDEGHSWNRTIAAGTANALFIEDNTFIITNDGGLNANEQIYHQQGARTVTRYNKFDGTAFTDGDSLFFDSHGNWGTPITQYRGQPIIEVYNNSFHAHKTYRFMNIRGGSVLFYNNSFLYDYGSAPTVIQFQEEESWTSGGPWCPACPVATAWPAQDQINNSFVWNNTINGSVITDIQLRYPSVESRFIQKERDYFMHAPQSSGGRSTYSGESGGTMTFSSVSANAYYPYTPYTYPHPLRQESGFNSNPPSPPTGLKVVP
jgi:hypothetical protein